MHFGLYSPAPIDRNRRALKLSRENGNGFFTKERVNMGVCHQRDVIYPHWIPITTSR